MKSKSFWCLEDDDKFAWALLEYNTRRHEAEQIHAGKASLSYTQATVRARRERVGLSLEESLQVIRWISEALRTVKNLCALKN